MGKMLIHIFQQKFHGRLQRSTTLTTAAGIHKFVDCIKQFTMLPVNCGIAGFQVLCQFISHKKLLSYVQFLYRKHPTDIILRDVDMKKSLT